MNAGNPCSGENSKLFPIRLCEVLESEFVALRGRMSSSPSWLLGENDICYEELLNRLRASLQTSAPTPVSVIRERLDKAGFKVPETASLDAVGRKTLLVKLNEALQASADLYDYDLLDPDLEIYRLAELRRKASGSSTIRPFHKRPARTGSGSDPADGAEPGQTSKDEQAQLNRLLLEAAFPASVISRVDRTRLDQLFQEIHALRGPEANYTALCLSGGGIRSAAFGLGVLQALARRGLLEKFDYLSTVSGGGYVGSWLSTWIHRHPRGLSGVAEEMKTLGQKCGGDFARRADHEPAPISFLRSYSHFLNPKAGLFSADTWTWVGIYLRNLSLNWLLIIPFLLLLLALPYVYSALLLESRAASGESFYGLFWIATLAATLTVVCVTFNRPSLRDTAPLESGEIRPSARGWFNRQTNSVRRQTSVLILGVAPLMLFSVVLTLLAWGRPQSKTPFTWEHIKALLLGATFADMPSLLVQIGLEHVVFWGEFLVLVAWLISAALQPQRIWRKRFEELPVMLFAGFFTWLLIAQLSEFAWPIGALSQAVFQLWSFKLYPAHLYAVLAVPIVAMAVLAGMTLFIGAVSKFNWIEDEDREWWGRFGAWILVCIVAWTALGAIAILGPPLLQEFPRLIAALGGFSGLIALWVGKSSLKSAAAGKGAPTGSSLAKSLLGVFGINSLASLSAVFLAVFLAFLSLLGSAFLKELMVWLADNTPRQVAWNIGQLKHIISQGSFKYGCGHGDVWPLKSFSDTSVFATPQVHLEIACQTPLPVIAIAVLALIAVVTAANLLINLNKFSLHAAYRIRIIRTFLGATRQDMRQPNPFTGFDPLDNIQMHELQPGLLRDGDLLNIDGFVAKLNEAQDRPDDSSAGVLLRCLCSPEHDRFGVLASRLRSYKPGQPVLKALQRDLLESLNRVLQTARLDRAESFARLVSTPENFEQYRDTLAWYVARGNSIFANRLLIEAAFPEDIKKFDFPPPPPHKLMHVINLTLNLVSGGNLAWQERKAAPFSVTPMHAGSYYLGYRECRDYGGRNGISLGTAAAISGAAVSPSMGYSSSPVTALLLALFNVRLGWWLGNPGTMGSTTYRRAEPRLSLRPLISEALGLTNDKSPYVYLSDGGHFENLGLYEMVLRRCRLIIASDAGADPHYQFEDLGNAVRKIRVDLGVPITLSELPIHRRRPDDHSGRYCTLGRIRYSCVDGKDAPDGVLIYFKPVLCGGEPQDVQEYAARNESFPQESTMDQFFGESQFESYRQLGEFALESAWGAPADSGKPWVVDFVERIRAHLGQEGGHWQWLEQWLADTNARSGTQPPPESVPAARETRAVAN